MAIPQNEQEQREYYRYLQLKSKQGTTAPTQAEDNSLLAPVDSISELVSAPVRGMRGLGVGVQRAIENAPQPSMVDSAIESVPGVGLLAQGARYAKGALNPNTLDRAAAATRPGYQPQAGEKIGSFVGGTAPFFPLGLGAGALAIGATTGAEEVAAGANPVDAAISGLGTAGTAYVTGKLGEHVVVPVAKSIFRGGLGLAKGIGRKVVDLVLDNPSTGPKTVEAAGTGLLGRIAKNRQAASEALKAAESLPDQLPFSREAHAKDAFVPEITEASDKAAGMAEGIVKPEAVAKSAATHAKNLATRVSKLSEEANQQLTGEVRFRDLADELTSLKNEIKSKRLPEAPSTKEDLAEVDGWLKLLKKNTDHSGKISQETIKKTLRSLDIETDGALASKSTKEAVLRQVRRRVDSVLKDINPEYGAAVEKVYGGMTDLDNVVKTLRLERGRNFDIRPTDASISAVKGYARGTKEIGGENVRKAGFNELERYAKSEAADEAKSLGLKEASRADRTKQAGLMKQKRSDIQAGRAEDKSLLESLKKAKTEAVGKAKSLPNPEDMSLGSLRQMSERAAKAGKGSPEEELLREKLTELDPEAGNDLAEALMTSAAREVFGRGRANKLVGAIGERTGEGFARKTESFGRAAGKLGKPALFTLEQELIKALTKKKERN